MAAKRQWVTVDDRKLKISNLAKNLYHQDAITKAEVVEYYLNISPVMLPLIKGRPLTMIRYPDGIDSDPFFQKNKPDYTPAWIKSITLGEGEEKADYIMADEKAALAWMANLASLEIHQMHSRRPDFHKPDYMVFDLDPPEGSDFSRVKETAFGLKNHIEEYGYRPFVKTTGGKGVHIIIPLEPVYDMRAVFEASKEIAQPFVDKYSGETTLQIKKKARKGRILIDVYRNRMHQTMVSPYSLRGRRGAPVSMPLKWDELSNTESASAYNLKNAVDKVKSDGDAWKEIDGYARELHTQKSQRKPVENDLPESDHHKSPKQLEEYRSKRNFTKTEEPDARVPEGEGNRFVIQRHHATRLHYDLRLEREGVLRSWAVPKGLPPRPDIKRLAVETEDHPLDYLTFEGEIPRDEYGGGQVWVYALGRYEMIKEKKDSLHFRLLSDALSGEYRMYCTDENQWLLEKVDEPQVDWLNDAIKPMNAKRTGEVPASDYFYEVKWDGIRALIALDDDQIRIRTRNQNDITQKFPELHDASGLRANCGLFDGEIVYLDDDGRPQFQKVINRLKHSSERKRKKSSSIYCYLFDCLYLDGRPLVDEPLVRRYEWLQDVIKKDTSYRISEHVGDGQALLKAAKEHNMEGIMAKEKASAYRIGKRSDRWLKVKTESTVDCLVIGYTKGKGSRSDYFGALHLAEKKDGRLKYRGKAGTGFKEETLKEISDELSELEKISKPVENTIDNKKKTTWVEPKLIVEVSYSSLTPDGLFRAAVFQRLRPDLYK